MAPRKPLCCECCWRWETRSRSCPSLSASVGSLLLPAAALGSGLCASVGRPTAFTGTSSETRLQDPHNSATLLEFPNHSPLWESSHRAFDFHRKLRSGRLRPGLDGTPAGFHHTSQWPRAALPCGPAPWWKQSEALSPEAGGFWGFGGFPGKEAGQRDRTMRAKEEGK